MQQNAQLYSDIKLGGWVDRYAPEAVRPYLKLARLDRPIGVFLLLFPCLWSVTLAGFSLKYFILFTIGAFVMRPAGCVINDLWDIKIDRKVERTSIRPLASGQVSVLGALFFLAALLGIGFGVLLQFNLFTIVIGAASLVLVALYPLMKRITYWPQLFLGLTFNWGALLGWSAVHNEIALPAILLYVAGIFWTLGYDTIYAHQDKKDDQKIGVKSLALRLGHKSPVWIMGFYMLTIILLALAGWFAGLDLKIYLAFLALAAIHLMRQIRKWDMDDQANCLARFKSNKNFGFLVLLAIAMGQVGNML